MAWPILLPLVPEVAGSLTAAGSAVLPHIVGGLATLGIINNRDEIRKFGSAIRYGGHGSQGNDQFGQTPTMSSDATRVQSPTIILPTQIGETTLMGKRNRARRRTGTSAVPAQRTTTRDTTPVISRDTATVVPGDSLPAGTQTGTESAPQPERNDTTPQRTPSFRERLGDRIAGRSSGQATGNSSGATPPNNNQNGSFIGRMLWETKNNNFGPNYWQWRNVGRVGLGLSYPAREHLWPNVGRAVKYMAVGPDSVPSTTTPTNGSYFAPQQVIAPTDTLDF